MFFSASQIKRSLAILGNLNPFFGTSFLALKKADIPIGSSKQLVFSRIVNEVMQTYYRPVNSYPGFYTPFRTSDTNNRWNNERYVSTSLQRITTDTFGKVLIHPKGSQQWGWKDNYIDTLLNDYLEIHLIPVFDLTVWLFRDREWYEGITKESIVELFFVEFKIKSEERVLFDITPGLDLNDWLQPARITVDDLLNIIGEPTDSPLGESAVLDSLRLTSVGPVQEIIFEPAARLNLITGDNGLGKTFLIECIWWALTGSWASDQAYPHTNATKTPGIKCTIKSSNMTSKVEGKYDRRRHTWVSNKRTALPGLSIFARSDGSFAIWDPAKRRLLESSDATGVVLDPQINLSRTEVLYGKSDIARGGRRITIGRGIIEDWLDWQYRSDIDKRNFELFTDAIKAISPHRSETLIPGERTQVPPDLQNMPTLRFPYGDVPFIHTSAGIQRIVAMVYVVVWSWFEHVKTSEYINKEPERSIILLIDEMEAHLHPFWQRTIVPALMNVIQSLNRQVQIQAVIATHSPLVLASVENIFDEEQDGLFHLYLDSNGFVRFENIAFVKRGKVDDWLTSSVFGLKEPRSLVAEQAIVQAEAVQNIPDALPEEVQRITNELVKVLGPDDQFWARWVYYARKKGVNI